MKKRWLLLFLPLLFESCELMKGLTANDPPDYQKECLLETDYGKVGLDGIFIFPNDVTFNFHFYDGCYSIHPDSLKLDFRDDDVYINRQFFYGRKGEIEAVPQHSEFELCEGDTLVAHYDIRSKKRLFLKLKTIDGLIRILPGSFITRDGQAMITDTLTIH